MKALILVDIQNDFVPGGALAVADGHAVVPVANRVQDVFEIVLATQDWHPADHGSFASNHEGKSPGDIVSLGGVDQVLWPDHCVQGTHGADFIKGLKLTSIARVFRKGTDPGIDSYSGFYDNGHLKDTGLGGYLKDAGVTDVYIMGLATDYCVKFTALDARGLGFTTAVIEDGCRGVNLAPDDSVKALDEMRSAGVRILTYDEVIGWQI